MTAYIIIGALVGAILGAIFGWRLGGYLAYREGLEDECAKDYKHASQWGYRNLKNKDNGDF